MEVSSLLLLLPQVATASKSIWMVYLLGSELGLHMIRSLGTKLDEVVLAKKSPIHLTFVSWEGDVAHNYTLM